MTFFIPQAFPGTPGEVSTFQLNNTVADAVSGTARNPSAVAAPSLTVSDPPTQTEVQAVADQVEELLAALKRV